MSRRFVIVLLSGLLFVLGLSGTGSATIHNITVGNNFFSPLNTMAAQGDTVRWTWVGGIPHSTTADGSSPKFWDSGTSSTSGFTYQITITGTDGFGPFPYHCSVHPSMVDTIWVLQTSISPRVNPSSTPGTDQNNVSVALSEKAIGEVYSVYSDFPGAGPSPSNIGWSYSLLNGIPGTWIDAVKPPDAPFTEEWNPWLSATAGGGYIMASSERVGGPWVATSNGIVFNISPGGGAAFGTPVVAMANTPGTNWLDYPIVEVDDDPLSPSYGDAIAIWTEYIDATGGDADGNGNFYDDPGDVVQIWSTTTNVGAGPSAPAYPLNSGAIPVGVPGLATMGNSMGSYRASIDIVGPAGTPTMPVGAAYVAQLDPLAGTVLIDANPAPGTGGTWGGLTGGTGPVAAAPFTAIPPVMAPGIKMANGVTVAVNNNAGPHMGEVYIAFTHLTASDADIMFVSSLDGGLTWSAPVRVNQDPTASGLDQWVPHMRVDDKTGAIVVTYYDRRNDPFNTRIEVWSSTSYDGGLTWRDCMVSTFGPAAPISNVGFPIAPYIGDYLGTDRHPINGAAFGWNDGTNTVDQDIFYNIAVRCDSDGDGIPDDVDNCPSVYNPAQVDGDGDGYGAACDCDDTSPSINPGATEVCDGVDNDCDGLTDDADPSLDLSTATTWYADTDGDGYGDPGTSTTACVAPSGYVADNTDCDDTSPSINPGALEVCDGVDNNCDGLTDDADPTVVGGTTWYADTDGDGYGDPGTSTTACVAPSGYVADNTDCDDTSPSINPGATEVCDGVDNNCDGLTDDADPAVVGGTPWYADTDGDGYGDPAVSTIACVAPSGYVADNTDCDDTDPTVNPGAGNCGCCIPPITGDINYDGVLDISDLLFFVDYQFLPGAPAPPCSEETDVDGSGTTDISDLLYLVDYQFVPGAPAPVPCP